LKQLGPLLSHEEGRRDTALTGSSRAANAVNEIFGYIRKVIVRPTASTSRGGRHGTGAGSGEHIFRAADVRVVGRADRLYRFRLYRASAIVLALRGNLSMIGTRFNRVANIAIE